MAAVLAAASYSRIGFSLYFDVRARRVRVPGGIKFHLGPGKYTLAGTLLGLDATLLRCVLGGTN